MKRVSTTVLHIKQMVKQQYQALVLKSFMPVRNSLVLLDQERGKLLVTIFQKRTLPAGALLEYSLEDNRLFALRQVNILCVPEQQARHDILFLHHVLELCNYFVPIGYKDGPLFILLAELCTTESKLSTKLKRLILFKLCSLLGIYPEDTMFHTIFFQKLARLSIHEMIREELLDEEMAAVDRWIYQCIALHPLADNFKTVHFLTHGGNP